VRRASQGDIELMSEKKVLYLKPALRLEQVGDKRADQLEKGKHRVGWCADSPSSRESRTDGIFGNDSRSARIKSTTAQAQRAQKSPAEQLRSQVQTLIARLRGRDMPDGIVKSNGRIEATQVDVAAKYPGRLATLTVDEGDEVTAGQRVATISSPETEAQLRAAQASGETPSALPLVTWD
jgi:biotin carboxyl carrier protein